MADAFLLKRQPSFSLDVVNQKRLQVLNKAHRLCREYLHGPWAKISIDELEVVPLGGGTTNKLYVCKLPEKLAAIAEEQKCPATVLLRVYGPILQDFKAQLQESVVFSILAERGIGPQLFAIFPGGRLEEYVPCQMPLKTQDLPKSGISKQIAQCMAAFHMLNMPVQKEPTYMTVKMFSYLERTKHTNFDDLKSHKLFKEILDFDLDELAQFVIKVITKDNPVVVFCHNNVQEGNLLQTKRSDGHNLLQLIDFEYSAYNYRGFDIANHFCEWMYDYGHQVWPFYNYQHKQYPTDEHQVNFVCSYLQAVYQHQPDLRNDPRWQREAILEEAKRFAMMSHLYWALWSIVQAKMSDIGFGYLEYAISRLQALKKQRSEWSL